MRRVYVSGPMTGLPDLNFPAFNAAAAQLRALGLDVVNPAELNPDPSCTWQAAMREDIRALVDCDTIVFLPGWQHSRGAKLERPVAQALGLAETTLEEVEIALATLAERQKAA